MTKKELLEKLNDVPDDTRVIVSFGDAYEDNFNVDKGIIGKGECGDCEVGCGIEPPDGCDWLYMCQEDCESVHESVFVIAI